VRVLDQDGKISLIDNQDIVRLTIDDAGVLATSGWSSVGSPPLGGNRVFAMGDSITAGNGTQSPLQLGSTQYLPWVGLLSNQRMTPIGFAAGPGITTATILSTHLPTVLAASPRPAACFVQGGTNDAGSFASVPLATTIANLTSIYQQLMGAGILPILLTNPPRTDSPSGARAALGKINDWIVRYASANGLPLVDLWTGLVDPTTGGYLAAYDSGDGIHPNAAGAKQMGVLINSAVATWFPNWAPRLAGYNADPNGHQNPLFLTDGNADGVPDTWTMALNGTPTVGIGADGSVLGNAWSIQRGTVDLVGTSNGIACAAGDRIALACKAFATVPGGGDVDIWLKHNGGTGISRPLTTFTQGFGWQTVYAEGVAPASGFAQCVVQVQGASATILKLAQFTLLNLTALGIN
jgi:lysophospholipase L1-like esterase